MRIEQKVQPLPLPGCKFVGRQRLEELRSNRHDATQYTEVSFRGGRAIRHEPGNRMFAARQDDFLAALDTSQKPRQLSLRDVNGDCFHLSQVD